MSAPSLDELVLRPIHAGDPNGALWVKASPAQWQEYISLSPYQCDHPRSEVRERTIANGGIQWRKQCLVCGRSTSNPIKREAGKDVPTWDSDLERSYEQHIEKQRAVLENQFIQQTLAIESGTDATYSSYLATDEWKQKRKLILERDKYICQGCLTAEAEEVHHLSYDDVPNELMFDLVSLCRNCHERVHRRKIAKLRKLEEASHRSVRKESVK